MELSNLINKATAYFTAVKNKFTALQQSITAANNKIAAAENNISALQNLVNSPLFFNTFTVAAGGTSLTNLGNNARLPALAAGKAWDFRSCVVTVLVQVNDSSSTMNGHWVPADAVCTWGFNLTGTFKIKSNYNEPVNVSISIAMPTTTRNV